MTCAQAEELILESFDAATPAPALDRHLADCAGCREFFATQRSLDGALAACYTPPALSAEWHAGLTQRVALEQRRVLPEQLRDLLHVGGGCGISVLCAWLLPFPPALVVTVGLAATFAGYLLLDLAVCDDV